MDFLVRFLGKNPQTLLIPIYSTTALYDNLKKKLVWQLITQKGTT